MDPVVLTALITIAIPAIAAPIITAVIAARNKKAEWARADLLEQRLIERGELAAKRAEEANKTLIASTVSVHNLASLLNVKIDEVHVLVNSAYTAALRGALEAVQAKLVVLLNNVAFRQEHKMEVDAAMVADVAATKKKMEELTYMINERLKQDVLAKEVKMQEVLSGKSQQAPMPVPVKDDQAAEIAMRNTVATERLADNAEEANALAKKK